MPTSDVCCPSDHLSTWLSQSEACRVLGKSKRTLNEMIERGEGPEKQMRPVKGRKPEPCYHPGDVERLRALQEPKPPVFSPESGVGPSRTETAIAPRADLVELFDRAVTLVERTIERQPKLPPPDRGPWLDIEAAAEYSGLSKALLRRVVRRLLDSGSREVILDGRLKIRRAAVAELNAADLREAADRADRPTAALLTMAGGAR